MGGSSPDYSKEHAADVQSSIFPVDGGFTDALDKTLSMAVSSLTLPLVLEVRPWKPARVRLHDLSSMLWGSHPL